MHDAVAIGQVRDLEVLQDFLDDLELPLALVRLVQLGHDDGGGAGGVLGEVELGEDLHVFQLEVALHVGGANANVGIVDLSEGLAALFGLVDGDRNDGFGHIGRHLGQIEGDDLVVAVVGRASGEIVGGVLDDAVVQAQFAEVAHVSRVAGLAFLGETQDRGVQVEISAGTLLRVPAQTDEDVGQLVSGFVERDVFAFGQVQHFGHDCLLPVFQLFLMKHMSVLHPITYTISI